MSAPELRAIAVPDPGEVRPGDSLPDKLLAALSAHGLGLESGDILVIKAGEVHSFKCIGDAPLVQLDVHLSPRFIQEYLT